MVTQSAESESLLCHPRGLKSFYGCLRVSQGVVMEYGVLYGQKELPLCLLPNPWSTCLELRNQKANQLFFHSFKQKHFSELRLNDTKIPTASMFNQIPLAVCMPKDLSKHTHKPKSVTPKIKG